MNAEMILSNRGKKWVESVGRGKKREQNREVRKVEIGRKKRLSTYMNAVMILSDRELKSD